MALSGSLEYEHSLSGTLQEPTSLSGELSLPEGTTVISGKEEIYIGSGEMPQGYKVQIDPTGKATDIVKDVQINGATIVDEKSNAIIPIANTSSFGVSKFAGAYAIDNWRNNKVYQNTYAIGITEFDYAIKQGMCDGKGQAWTSEEKANARNRLGFDLEPVIIDIETTEEVKVIEIVEYNGKPLSDYDFKQLWVFVESAGSGDATTSEITTRINSYPTGSMPYLSSPNGIVNNKQKVYWGGYLDIRNGLALSNGTFSISPQYRVNAQITQSSYMLLFEKNINKITIQSHSTVMPVGTKFKIVLR